MKLVKAKKDHKCDQCGEKIPKGSRYWRNDHNNTEEFVDTEKAHINCDDYEKRITAQ